MAPATTSFPDLSFQGHFAKHLANTLGQEFIQGLFDNVIDCTQLKRLGDKMTLIMAADDDDGE